MNLFIEKHKELLALFLDHEVNYIVIGGYSVIFHGYRRTTGVVDLWIKPDNSNKEKLVSALREFDFDEKDLEEILNLDFTKHLAFSIWEEPEKVDFLTYISLVHYNEANSLKVIADVDELKIPFIHLNHLVLSKMNTGRPQDIADVEKLQQINKFRK